MNLSTLMFSESLILCPSSLENRMSGNILYQEPQLFLATLTTQPATSNPPHLKDLKLLIPGHWFPLREWKDETAISERADVPVLRFAEG